jgi:hypothetical protein
MYIMYIAVTVLFSERPTTLVGGGLEYDYDYASCNGRRSLPRITDFVSTRLSKCTKYCYYRLL